MEVEEQIRTLRDFLEQNYHPQLLEGVRKGQSFLAVDFAELIKFNMELSEEFLENPVELLKAAELAVKEFDLPTKIAKFNIRFSNLPDSQRVSVSDIRSKHLNKFVKLEGVVRQKTDVRPHVTASKYECPSCGNILTILQLDKKYKEPSRCGCGRKGKFKEIHKELVDGQGLVLEEAPDELDGTQPRRINVFLKDDLVSPISERRSSPGSRVRVYGWATEVPITLKSGGQATKYDLIIEANFVEPLQEDQIESNLSPEELQKIEDIAKDPNPVKILADNIAPSIYGHDKIKEALVLQLAGGSRKVRPDGMITRGDMHILLIGDPGCIAGESYIALYHKGMKPIHTLGNKHGQPLREAVTVIRKNQYSKPYQFTSNFQIYPQQATLRVVTETGKELICTYNHPLLTKEGWQRADALQVGSKIRVMPKIPNYIKRYKKTNFRPVKKSSGKLKENIYLPEKVTPSLASLFGYIIGDGHVHKNGYRVFCYVNDEERDLLPLIQSLWKENFNVDCSGRTETLPKEKVIREKKGTRKIMSTQPLHTLTMNSRMVSFNLKFLMEKRVPHVIFESPPKVISAFLRWLFEADGCTFHTGRGKTSVQLKSASLKLLQEVQLLLLYFGIQARIIGDNLCIRRSYDISLFAQKIGFVSQKKKKKLSRTIEGTAQKNDQQKRKAAQQYEKIASLQPYKVMDVYDVEVHQGHQFIANGIVSHNSAKSQLLKRISRVGPKARFTSGKGATAAGLTASVVKDEFLGGWSLEAGTLVLANHGFAVIDEMDKMGKDDRSALHEALEQQSYHYDTEIMFADGSTEKIGVYVDMLMERYKENLIFGKECEILPFPENETETLLTTNFNSIEEIPIDRISRHKAPDHFFKITLSNGRWITVTPEHPLYVADNGEIITLEARSVEEGMLMPAPRALPTRKAALHKKDEVEGLFYGLQCSEGYSYKSEKHGYAEIGISNTNPLIYSLAQEVMRTFFEKEPSLHLRSAENNAKSTKDLITVRVSSQQGYALLQQKVPELLHKAPIKRIPHYVKIGSDCLQRYFLQGFFLGDGFVDQERIGFCTSSGSLAQDLQQVCLQQGIYSYIETEQRELAQYYKIVLSGSESLARFLDVIHPADPRKEKMDALLKRSAGKKNDRDIIPCGHVGILYTLLKSLRMDDGYFYGYSIQKQHAPRKTCQHYLDKIQQRILVGLEALEQNNIQKIRRAWNIPLKEIAMSLGTSVGTMYNYEKKGKDAYLQKVRQHAEIKKQKILRQVQKLCHLIDGDIRFVRIKKVEKIENIDQRWTYDVTIEPYHTFISQNLVLHNTVSIAKANIQATLRCETSVLAAANPKFGRFDPSGLVAEQIDLPPTLINRFDLIFPIKDLPNREKDEKVASFILALHKDPDKVGGTISTELLKKYFSYVRQKINPKMTDAAIDELKQYYISMRNSGQSEGTAVKTIPITARQLEALVRLSEAAAKVRLATTVSREDAQKAIELLDYCLNQIARDSETGKIDIDRLSSRITATQRGTIAIIKEIINSVEEELKSKTIPIENIISAAQGKNISPELVEETLEKLRRSGDIFEPKRGSIQKL